MSLTSEQNKHKIIDTTFLLSLKYGFDNVSIKQIKEESGLSTGTIYYYFKNKDEILEYMVKTYLTNSFYSYRDDIKNFEGTFIDKLRFTFESKGNSFATKTKDDTPYVHSRPEFDHREYFMLFKSIYHFHPEVRGAFHRLNEKLHSFYYELFQEAIDNGEIRDDVDAKTLAIYFQTSLKGYTDMWMFHPEFSFEEIVDSNIKMIEESLKKP